MHPKVTLTGGKVPEHVPGAYPRLGCCGGPVTLVAEPPITLTVTAYLNEEARFDAYRPGQRCRQVGAFHFRSNIYGSRTEYVEGALALMWEVGNKYGSDADGDAWPRSVRSLSVGDVLHVVNEPLGIDRWVAVAGVGWTDIDPAQEDSDGRPAQSASGHRDAGPLGRGGVAPEPPVRHDPYGDPPIPAPDGQAVVERERAIARQRIWGDTVATFTVREVPMATD